MCCHPVNQGLLGHTLNGEMHRLVGMRAFSLDADYSHELIPPAGPLEKTFCGRVVVLIVTHDPISRVAARINEIFLGRRPSFKLDVGILEIEITEPDSQSLLRGHMWTQVHLDKARAIADCHCQAEHWVILIGV